MFNPRSFHKKALKQSDCYLEATKDKGLILNPSKELNFDAYPDVTFQEFITTRSLHIYLVLKVELEFCSTLQIAQCFECQN